MTDQITLEEALKLVIFRRNDDGTWCIDQVLGSVKGSVKGIVGGTINGRKWQFVETPREKLKRLIKEGADKAQLLEAFNQLEES